MNENIIDFKIEKKERNDQLNQILAETSQGKNVMMKVAQKIKFNERVQNVCTKLQIIAASTYLATWLTSFAMVANGNQNGPLVAIGAPISLGAFIAATYFKNRSKENNTKKNIFRQTNELLTKEQEKTIQETGKDIHLIELKKYAASVYLNAINFTQNVKNLTQEHKSPSLER